MQKINLNWREIIKIYELAKDTEDFDVVSLVQTSDSGIGSILELHIPIPGRKSRVVHEITGVEDW
jgi:phosphoheptose isomerase